MKFARQITSGVSALVLALGTMPGAAFALVQEQPRTSVLEQAVEQRALEIDSHSDAYADGQIIVVYKRGTGASAKAAAGLSAQAASVAGIPDASAELLSEGMGADTGAAVKVELPSDVTVGQAVATAELNPDVAYAQPNYRYSLLDEPVEQENARPGAGELTTQELPDDPILKDSMNSGSSPNQWWIYAVNAQEAWERVPAEKDVTVAVLDTGINFEHRDLKNNIITKYAWDSYLEQPLLDAPTAEPTSEMDHGSHVAGIVAAEANNGFGIAGVSYNARILPICVFHESESTGKATCDDEDLIRAYDYLLSDPDGDGISIAQETNTHVVNMSLGGYLADDPEYEYDYVFEDKIEQAQEEANILTVAAGGNGDDFGNPRTDPSYPSDYDAVMSVVALKSETERTHWSDYNEYKDIAAPGADIYSTWYYGDSFTFKSGTSMASPVVAGIAALLWAYNPDITVEDVKHALYSTASDLGARGFDKYYGWGRVDAEAAVKSLGTASVKAEHATMARTLSQQMTAASIANPGEKHTWVWSVVDEDGNETDIARINQDGVLTAVKSGSVEVRVQASDDETLQGKRFIEITDIEIPGGINASANPNENTIAVRWSAAEAATSYRIMRTETENGAFTQIAEVPASEITDNEGSAIYLDRTARPSIDYWYSVIPVGTLDGAPVTGVESNMVRCYYTDKAALKQQISAAEDLLSTTKISVDGSELRSDEMWTAEGERTELNAELRSAYTAYYSGALLQADVDKAAADLAAAAGAFSSLRRPGLIAVSSPEPADDPQPGQPEQPEQPAKPTEDSQAQQPAQPAKPVQPEQPAKPADNPQPASDKGNQPAEQNASSIQEIPSSGQVMLRLYNPNSGEHFYTASVSERDDLVRAGWSYEGEGWTAPRDSNVAVYRLYNPNAGDHHYTTSSAERDELVAAGWSNEGIGWFSDDAHGVKLLRLYNPNAQAGSHHYTVDESELNALVAAGWRFEGVGWYGME